MTVKELFNLCDEKLVVSFILQLEYGYLHDFDVKKEIKVRKKLERYFRRAKKIKPIQHKNETVHVQYVADDPSDTYFDVFTVRDGDNERYAIELDSWNDILGRNVKDYSELTMEVMAAEIFYNMSFFGYSYLKNKIRAYFIRKSLNKQVKKLSKELGEK